MTEEIKEILDIHIRNDIELSVENQKKVKDYITNIQQENEDFKTIIKQYVDVVLHDRKIIEDYKQRNEKAIEYIENNKKETSSHFNGKEYLYRNFTLCCEPNDLLNILNGSDGNE